VRQLCADAPVLCGLLAGRVSSSRQVRMFTPGTPMHKHAGRSFVSDHNLGGQLPEDRCAPICG
jgi:hypothetical protein